MRISNFTKTKVRPRPATQTSTSWTALIRYTKEEKAELAKKKQDEIKISTDNNYDAEKIERRKRLRS